MSALHWRPRAAALEGLLGRVRVRVRLLLLGLMALALAGIPTVMQWRETQRSIERAELGVAGIEPVQAMLELVRLVQQHRGLTTLVLAGDGGAEASRADRQAAIDAAFAAIDGAAQPARRDAFDPHGWNEAKAAWSALLHRLHNPQASVADAIGAHSALIAQLLGRVDGLAHAHALRLDPERDAHLLAAVGIASLPQLAEVLARARAGGVAQLLAGSAHADLVAGSLGEPARGAIATVLRALQEFLGHRPAAGARLAGPLHEALTTVEAALFSVGDGPRVDRPREAALRHYATFTTAIDAVLALDHAVLVELQGLLSERVRLRRHERAGMLGAMGVLLALGTWLGLCVGRSITRQIGAEPADIVALTETLAAGGADPAIEVQEGAEGSILAAMARLQRALQEAELRYADLIGNMPLGVLVVRDRQVVFANAMAAQMRGAEGGPPTGEALTGETLAQWVVPADRPRVEALFGADGACAASALVADAEVVCQDGSHRHWRLRAQAIDWEGGRAHLVTLGDITEHTLAERRHRELSAIVEQTSDAIMLAAADGTIRYVNPGFERLSGYRSDEVLGRKPSMFKSGAHDEHFYRQLWATIRAGRTFHAQVVNRRKDGSECHVIKTITPMFDAQGRMVSFVNIDKDFSDQQAERERLARLALHDPLTGLANRALLEDHVREAIARDQRRPEPFALLFVDLDGFKAVNDSQGHPAGDAVLQQVAHRLQSHVRETDTAARLGGDEFVLLLQGVGDVDTAGRIATKLMRAVRQPVDTGCGTASVGASVGIALYPQDGRSVDALLDRADAAMYRAKRAGGNCLRLSAALPAAGPTPPPLREAAVG